MEWVDDSPLTKVPPKEWEFRLIRHTARAAPEIGSLHRDRLWLYWEPECSAISDDYTPDEANARAMWNIWKGSLARGSGGYANELGPDWVRIWWFVEGDLKLEAAPHEAPYFTHEKSQDFLTFYTWPVDPETKKPLDWLKLPVQRKVWNSRQANKGGFIGEYLNGWRPSPLQPYMHLPSLEKAAHGAEDLHRTRVGNAGMEDWGEDA
jgi:hypothetical protein